ncbi:aldo/keto reductase [Aerococcus sp. 1KP-2016]|uniref:aldo/keto reductase n=1 Tax=Aerococcus sp. 1KP-2016 TaxID=1981982 RepID=UPI000B990440|nr:aldo/keto reductase [Aerococcus sp. 1KP-2016]OYQ65495.1 2,5-diketo-D-gluconic acid reductase [Aerococcus sp. 1KP-2016]
MNLLNKTLTLNNGVEIPQIALGTWQTPTANAVTSVKFALENGYKHIDGAAAYENSKGTGVGIKASGLKREDVFMTSKVRGDSKTYEKVMDDFFQELKDLDTSYIDLILVHCPTPWRFFSRDEKRLNFFEENLQVWRALEELYNKGFVRAIGVSNFNVEDIQNLIDNTSIKPAVNQIKYHIGDTQDDIVAYCEANDIIIEAYSSLGTGRLLGNEEIKAIADKYGVSVPQLCYRYPLQKGHIILPKSVHEEYIIANAELDFEISAEDMATLDAMEI